MSDSSPTKVVALSEDEASLVCRGLLHLIDSIELWRKKQTGIFFKKANPYDEHGALRIEDIRSLIERIDKTQAFVLDDECCDPETSD